LLLPVGYTMMLQMACSNTLIQVMVPDALRGRVMAVYSMMFMGMAPIGALFGGALADRLGVQVTVAIGGFSVSGGCGLVLVSIAEDSRGSAALDRSSGTQPAGEPAEMSAQAVED